MQHPITNRSDNTSNRQSICATGLHQNLNRAFVLFELTPASEISLLDPYERTLGKCCVDPLRAPRLSGFGPGEQRSRPNERPKRTVLRPQRDQGQFRLTRRGRRSRLRAKGNLKTEVPVSTNFAFVVRVLLRLLRIFGYRITE